MSPRVAFYTLGCKVNQYDTQAVADRFRAAGFEVVDFDGPADVYVINTCTVTSLGDKKSRQALRRAKRQNPGAAVVAMGCYAQTSPGEVAAIPGVDLVVGTADRGRLPELVAEHWQKGGAVPSVNVTPFGRTAGFEELGAGAVAERTRATVKVQEGCRQYCSYCKVPYARGPERSRPAGAVLAEVERLVGTGYHEVVLTGIHLGSYGRDFTGEPRWDLARLAAEVAAVPGLRRLRLSSLEPTDVTGALIALVAENPILCRHFHLPLQSGDDTVLRRMNRHYTTAEYARVVDRIRTAVPEAALTTDLIAGFPGESDAAFARGCEFVRRMAFSRLHVFPYSPRQGTPAAAFPDQLPEELRRERAARLSALGEELSGDFHRRLVGQTVEVLFEDPAETAEDGLDGSETIWSGLTDTYVRVLAASFRSLAGEFRMVTVDCAGAREVRGRLAGVERTQE